MRLIFEDHKYDIEKIDNVLSFLLSDKDRARNTYIPKCVGYFYNPNIDNGEGKPKGDIVFVLPKVLLSPATDGSDKKETLFNVEPEQLINLDWATWKDCDLKEGDLTKREIFDFIDIHCCKVMKFFLPPQIHTKHSLYCRRIMLTCELVYTFYRSSMERTLICSTGPFFPSYFVSHSVRLYASCFAF